MAQLVANVLEMTRLEAGAIALNRDWHALGEIAGSVLRRLRDALAAHPVDGRPAGRPAAGARRRRR